MNRLGGETSPYLLQHKDNPVDWYPWGEQALAAAREQNRPLLVSIGYSACHWCHVMAHESFENAEIAALMNAEFICVKVDREERPDIDAICMDACQAITGQGGWPLNVFLTPDLIPFFAGTYFPAHARPNAPASWPAVLRAIANAWRTRPDELRQQGAKLVSAITANATRERPPGAGVHASVISDCVQALAGSFDPVHGGWGGAPKFPPHCTLEFLLAVAAGDGARTPADAEPGEGTRAPDDGAPGDSTAADPRVISPETRERARELAFSTLRAMARGGIYDQVGGGFSRYTVDATWTVPHFEKMLYDNALLARAYLHAWQLGGEQRFAEVCCETLDWALREMRGPEGGFCSALDADSDGEEGKFYVWSLAELQDALDDGSSLAADASAYFGASAAGNFEHATNVLEARGPIPQRLPEIRCKLFGVRAQRVRPGLDDKRLSSWNALMISALAQAGAALGRDDYLKAARACAAFVLEELRDQDGTLLRTWKDGRGHLPAYLEDHAYLLQALLTLYEATFESRWYAEAVNVADAMIERFGDREHGGFFTTAADQPHLVTRRKDLEDAPIPAANSAAALGLLRLSRLSGHEPYERWAVGVLALHAPIAERHPGAFGHLLQALDLYLSRSREIAVVGESADGPLTRTLRERFLPHAVIAGTDPTDTHADSHPGDPTDAQADSHPRDPTDAQADSHPGDPTDAQADARADSGRGGADGDALVPLLRGRTTVAGAPAAYVCENFTCRLPVSDPDSLILALEL